MGKRINVFYIPIWIFIITSLYFYKFTILSQNDSSYKDVSTFAKYITFLNNVPTQFNLRASINYNNSKQIDTQFIKYVKKPFYEYYISVNEEDFLIDHLDGGFVSGYWNLNYFLYDKLNQRLTISTQGDSTTKQNNPAYITAKFSKDIINRIIYGQFSSHNNLYLSYSNNTINVFTNNIFFNSLNVTYTENILDNSVILKDISITNHSHPTG